MILRSVLLKFETHYIEDTIHSDKHRLFFNGGEKVYYGKFTLFMTQNTGRAVLSGQ